MSRQDLHVVLVEPEIHGNTGNVGRTCLAVHAQLHLVRPLGFSLDDAQVRRAGLDYWPRVQPEVWSAWSELEPRLEELGEPWLFTAEAERPYWEADLRGPTALVFGKESVGLDPGIRERYAERCLRFPIRPGSGVRSLNLANCAALACYEALRQRRRPPS